MPRNTEKTLQADLENAKTELCNTQKKKKRQRNHKKKSISWELLLPRKRKKTHPKKDSTARNHSTTLGTKNPSLNAKNGKIKH